MFWLTRAIRIWLRWSAACATLATCAAASGGCDRPDAVPSFAVVSGVVLSHQRDTGELAIRPASTGAGPSRIMVCVMTPETEIYVNERLSEPHDVLVGDSVELVVDRAARLGRHVVSQIQVDRADEPVAPVSLESWLGPLPQKKSS